MEKDLECLGLVVASLYALEKGLQGGICAECTHREQGY